MTTPGTDIPNALTNLDLYACPQCRSAFTYRADEEIGDRPRGMLTCASGHTYRVDGIPRFVVDEGYTSNFGKQWAEFRKTQVDSATGNTESRDSSTAPVGRSAWKARPSLKPVAAQAVSRDHARHWRARYLVRLQRRR